MKKILAIVLVLAMLIPLGVTAQAEGVAAKPFYHVNISASEVGYDHFYQMTQFWSPDNQFGPDDEPVVQWSGEKEIEKIAEALKEEFNSRPDGTRYINFFSLPSKAFKNMNKDILFMEDAVVYIQKWMNAFLQEYKRIGGKLDGFITDLEYENAEANYLQSRIYVNDNLIYDKIVKNPMYQTKLRPLLVERGFKFYPNPTEYTPEIFGIYSNAGDEYASCRGIWNVCTRILINQYVNEAVYEPLMKYYPDAIVSDYQSKNVNAWDYTPLDYGGNYASAGNWVQVGNSSNDNTYSYRPSIAFFQNSSGPVYNSNGVPTYINALFANCPFNGLLWDMNNFKDLYGAANDGEQISLWFSHFMYNQDNPGSPSETPYYAETVLHMGMLDPVFLGYTTPAQFNGDTETYELALEIIEDIMVELTKVAGYADRKPIHIPANWNSSFVLSGMYANGRNIFRITPDTTQVSLENFKVADAADPTFFVNGQTVTFPGGKIIADGNVREVGTCGYWVETAKDVMPVVTSVENRFEAYPAYIQDFESFQAGTEMAFAAWKPELCWEAKKNKETVCVIKADPSDPNNQVLEISGPSYVLKNTQIPNNIKAGDSYAKHQVWEVTLTLPANLSADAEMVLFDAYGQRAKTKDTGIVIKGGKVYYDKAGESVELTGVDLSAGGKITVQREMDFTDNKAVICDYAIYDASGALLGEAKNVPVAEIDVPVLGIGFSFKNLDKAVLMDDYTIRITDVVADFTLYDARLGTKVTEIDKARAEDTAYRLSWVNAAKSEKTYQVIAAYYNGDALVSETVLKEIKMAPGTDGVDTGVVKNETEGQTLLVYLKDLSPAEDEDTGSDKTPSKGSGNDMTLIIVAAVVVIVLCVCALLIMLMLIQVKKNKKAASAKEAPAEEEASAEEAPVIEETSEEETPETDAE